MQSVFKSKVAEKNGIFTMTVITIRNTLPGHSQSTSVLTIHLSYMITTHVNILGKNNKENPSILLNRFSFGSFSGRVSTIREQYSRMPLSIK